MDTAQIALLLSVLTASWQVGSFILNGARLRISLYAIVEGIDGSSLSVTRLSKGSDSYEGLRQYDAPYWMELARVEITNAGRIATSVSQSGLLFVCPFTRSPLPAVRRRIGLAPVSKRRGLIRRAEFVNRYGGSSDLPVRLEPGESVSFVFDFWSMVDSHKAERPKDWPLLVQGVAQVAGGRVRRSSRRRRWRIEESTESFRPVKLTQLQRAYRGFWRGVQPEKGQRIDYLWERGKRALIEGHDFATVAQRMGPNLENNELQTAKYMLDEYER